MRKLYTSCFAPSRRFAIFPPYRSVHWIGDCRRSPSPASLAGRIADFYDAAMKWIRLAIPLLLLAICPKGIAENPVVTKADPAMPPGFDPARHMRVSEVKEGMTGYGISVFKGDKLERFNVTVLSILHNFNPKYDVVLIDCKGANLEHTGSIAGMSGSPVYLKDEQGRERMIGAFAYGWPMMKDPYAGVQPIEYMLAIPTTQPAVESAAKLKTDGAAAAPRLRWSIEDSLGMLQKTKPALVNVRPTGRYSEVFATDSIRLQPLATPLMTSGFSPRILEQLNGLLGSTGLVALQAGGIAGGHGEGAVLKLEPGSVLAVPLMTGDSEMTAIGTCTEVVGDRIMGFGHSFNNEGPIALPMGTGRINAVIANLNTSFKLGALSQTQGTLLADQTVGVAGKIGPAPAMAPMDLKVTYTDGTADQNYHFNLAMHPKLTPMLAAAALGAAISGAHDVPLYHTADYDLTLEFSNGQSVHLVNTTVNAQVPELFNEIGIPIIAASENPFEKLALRKFSGTVRVSPEAREAHIESVTLPRLKFQPGETAKIYLNYRPFRKAGAILPIEFEIPRELPDGAYQLVVTDWAQYLEGEKIVRPFRFTAESGDEMFAALKDLLAIRHNAIYVQMLRKADGVAIGRTAMPHLPSSRREVLMGAGLSSTTPFVSSTLKIIPTEEVMNGAANFTITIDREFKIDTGAKPGKKIPAVPVKPEEPKPKIGIKTETP